jgi:hypothetical protein
MNEFHDEISCKHPLQGSAQGLGKLKGVLCWMTGNFCCWMAKLTHEDIHIPFQSECATWLQPRVLVVTRMFLVVEVLFNLEVSFLGSYRKGKPHCIVVVDAHVGCVHGNYYVDALQVYLAFRAAALNLYGTLPLW